MVDLVIVNFSFGSQSCFVVVQKVDLFLSEVASFVFASDGDHVDVLSFEPYQKVISITKTIIFIDKKCFVLFFFLDGEDDSLVDPIDFRQRLRVVLIGAILVVLIAKLQGSKSSEAIVVKGRLILMLVFYNNKGVC